MRLRTYQCMEISRCLREAALFRDVEIVEDSDPDVSGKDIREHGRAQPASAFPDSYS